MDEQQAYFQGQADLQQQQINAQQGMNAPYMIQQQQATQAAILEQTNPDKVLFDIELKLRGQKINKLDMSIQNVSQPLMNDAGINMVITLLSTVVNENTILSALDEKQIKKIIIEIGDIIIDDLVLNCMDYEIKNPNYKEIIHAIAVIPSFMALMRALRGGERAWLGKTTVESISTAPRFMPQRKEGVLSHFKL